MDSVINLPIGDGSGDPNRPSVSEALEVLDDADAAGTFSPAEKLLRMAGTNGDISHIFSAAKLAEIGGKVRRLIRARQERPAALGRYRARSHRRVQPRGSREGFRLKDYPWPGAANMKWPLLTIASMQFNARMYPAVIKGDEAVLCKVIGNDDGKPVMAPNPQSGEIQPVPELDPQPASRRLTRRASRSSARNGMWSLARKPSAPAASPNISIPCCFTAWTTGRATPTRC
jgi:hypothetical protein